MERSSVRAVASRSKKIANGGFISSFHLMKAGIGKPSNRQPDWMDLTSMPFSLAFSSMLTDGLRRSAGREPDIYSRLGHVTQAALGTLA